MCPSLSALVRTAALAAGTICARAPSAAVASVGTPLVVPCARGVRAPSLTHSPPAHTAVDRSVALMSTCPWRGAWPAWKKRYFRGETHYIVCTPRKEGLLALGVLQKPNADVNALLDRSNLDGAALQALCRSIARSAAALRAAPCTHATAASPPVTPRTALPCHVNDAGPSSVHSHA